MNRRFIFDRREKREQRRTWPFSRQGRRLKLTKAGRIWLAGLAAALLVAVCVLPTLAEWLGEAGSEPAVSTEEISVEQEQDLAAEQTPDSNVNSISDPEEEERDDYLQDLIIPRQQYNTFLSEAYLGNNEATEQVNPQTGEFTYRHTDYSLPGKNGLDLNITRIYKSAQTPRFDRSLDVYHLTKSRDSTYSGFYEQRYNIGAGVRFSFPTIEVRGYQEDNTYRYLHDESGAVRRMIGPETIDGVKTYELEGYELEDLRIIEEQTPTFTGVIYGLGYDYSKYVMIEKDGTKTYFSGRPNSDNCLTEGRIMAIVDRYGNTIRFDYEYYIYDYSVSWDVNVGEDRWSKRVLLSKITDTMGREVTLEYPKTEADVDEVKDGTFNVKITTPDNQMLVYSFKNFFVDGPNTDYALRQQLVKVSVLGDASQFGVGGNYGEMKYFYGYNVMPFQYKDTGYVQNSEYLDVNFILYGQTNRAKILTYDKGTKSYSYSGFMEYPKVVKEEDVLLEGCSLNDIRDRFDDVNYNLRNYLAVAEYVGEKNYTYNGEPDGYEVDADTDKTSKTYPLINFEDTKAKDSFEEISEQSPQWQVTSDQAKSGEKSMCSLTNVETPAIKLPANLLKDGSLIFHAMEQGDGDLYVGIGTNEPSQMTKFELTGDWNRYSLELPQDSADIWFLYDRKGTDAAVYLDDITVGVVYSSQVQDEYGTITYQYDPLHQTYAIQTASQDNAYTMTEQREYDLYGQLRKATTSRLDEGEQTPLVVEKLYTYDQYGNLLEYQGPEYANAKLTYTYDTDRFHQLTGRKLSDAASGQTLAESAYRIDDNGNTTLEARYTSNGFVMTDFSYDSSGNMIYKESYTNADDYSYITRYEYAPAGTYDGYTAQGGKAEYANEPLYLTRVYTGTSGAPLSEKRYTYEFDTGLMTSETKGEDNATTSYTYDSQYRLTSAISARRISKRTPSSRSGSTTKTATSQSVPTATVTLRPMPLTA